jgi:hypothetical protein
MRPEKLGWDGSYQGGRMLVDLTPGEVWDRLEAKVDRPILQGGPWFTMKPYCGTVERGRFRYCRQWDRRSYSAPHLVGTFCPAAGCTMIDFEVRTSSLSFVLMLVAPLAVLAMSIGSVVAGILGGPADWAQALLCALGAAFVMAFFLSGLGLSLWWTRHSSRQLVLGLRRLFEDVVIEEATPALARWAARSSTPAGLSGR